jgi:hypothetical protein
VPAELLPLVPLFCRSLTNMGTATESFIDLTERIGRKTGGLSIYPFTSSVRGQKEPLAYIMLRGKVSAPCGLRGAGRAPRLLLGPSLPATQALWRAQACNACAALRTRDVPVPARAATQARVQLASADQACLPPCPRRPWAASRQTCWRSCATSC